MTKSDVNFFQYYKFQFSEPEYFQKIFLEVLKITPEITLWTPLWIASGSHIKNLTQIPQENPEVHQAILQSISLRVRPRYPCWNSSNIFSSTDFLGFPPEVSFSFSKISTKYFSKDRYRSYSRDSSNDFSRNYSKTKIR